MSNTRAMLLCVAVLSAGMLSACGGGSSTNNGPDGVIAVSVTPLSTLIDQGATMQFSARVSGSSNQAVTWSIREGSAGGSISQSGIYTAPAAATNVHVVATSVADPNRSGSAPVTVNAVSISMVSSATVPRGRQHQFSAAITGTVVREVTWSVEEGAGGGNVTNDGVYSAPMAGGPFHVTARSIADPSKAATAEIVLADGGFRMLGTSTLVPRTNHTATLLPDGKVLIAGGEECNAGGCSGVLSSAELFDPATEGFSFTASMVFARSSHTATLLNDGTVLVSGGGSPENDSNADDYTTAEIYDPATHRFSRVGDMTQGRTMHTAALLVDGRVLLAGGSADLNGFGLFPSKTAELYDPGTKTFAPAGDMPDEASSHTTSVLQDGTVFVAGGWGVDCPYSQTAVSIFDPSSQSFSPGMSLATARAEHTATALNDGRVLITGGFADTCDLSPNTLDTAVVFNPVTSSYSPERAMREPRAGHSATLLMNGEVLVVGSFAELFDPVISDFEITGDPSVPGNGRKAVRLSDGRVLFTGSTSPAEIYE